MPDPVRARRGSAWEQCCYVAAFRSLLNDAQQHVCFPSGSDNWWRHEEAGANVRNGLLARLCSGSIVLTQLLARSGGDRFMHLDTTLGPLPLPERGCILPHEHVFVDLRTWDQPGYAEADPEAVVRLMSPQLERARDAGVAAIVEPGGIGVGRRVDILAAVSQATQFPLVAPTGVYREPWLPPWVREARETDLAEWMKSG